MRFSSQSRFPCCAPILLVATALFFFSDSVKAQVAGEANPGQPEGAFRVMPVFPAEQVIQPDESRNEGNSPRRAIIINPDGTVTGSGADNTVPDVRPAIPVETVEPVSVMPAALVPGQNGMDGIPIDPTQPIRVAIESPTDRQILNSQEVDIFIDLDNYKLGDEASGGNRLHYILNNESPQVLYDAISPISFKNLSQGGHTIRVFAVRPDGRMFRDSEAYAVRHFFVIRKDFQNYTDPQKPYLTVNLPTGEQVATDEEGRIIFDYKLHNIEPGQGYELRYKIGAYEGFLNQDGPVYWSNLATGKHRIEVELLKDNRQPAIGPFNRLDREFTVEKVMRAEPVTAEEVLIE